MDDEQCESFLDWLRSNRPVAWVRVTTGAPVKKETIARKLCWPVARVEKDISLGRDRLEKELFLPLADYCKRMRAATQV